MTNFFIRLYKFISYVSGVKEKMTVGEYAKLVGVQRDTIHKRLQRGEKLAGVSKIEKTAGGVNILVVDREKALAK